MNKFHLSLIATLLCLTVTAGLDAASTAFEGKIFDFHPNTEFGPNFSHQSRIKTINNMILVMI